LHTAEKESLSELGHQSGGLIPLCGCGAGHRWWDLTRRAQQLREKGQDCLLLSRRGSRHVGQGNIQGLSRQGRLLPSKLAHHGFCVLSVGLGHEPLPLRTMLQLGLQLLLGQLELGGIFGLELLQFDLARLHRLVSPSNLIGILGQLALSADKQV
jgi:hypothetical protein